MSLSLPAQALNVSSWDLGWLTVGVSHVHELAFLETRDHTVAVEIIEVTHGGSVKRAVSSVGICRIIPLVVFDVHQHIVFSRFAHQS